MTKPVKNIAVILAGGQGTRAGFNQPKQLIKLAGKPVIEHTLLAFNSNHNIDEIVIVSSNECTNAIENIVINSRLNKVKSIINGGPERYSSSLCAINATEHYCKKFNVNLIFHDAVRPLISQNTIDSVAEALSCYRAVDVVVRTTDTIISADEITNTIQSIPNRANLKNGQTPQAFSHSVIKEAYRIGLSDPNFSTTDDCGVVLKYLPQEKIYLVEGENENIKLTYEEDLHIIDKLLQLRSVQVRETNNNKLQLSQLKNKVIVIFGGTSGIGLEISNIASAYQALTFTAGTRSGVNISNMENLSIYLENIYRQHGRIDYIVNSAAILNKQPLVNMTSEEIRNSIETNYFGAINIAIAGFEYLKKSQGQLLNFTSSSYTYGRAYYSLYSSSKAAVVNLTQALADEWSSHGVKVNCINPERTATPMRTKAFGSEPQDSLLSAKLVAEKSLLVLLSMYSGQIFDVKKI